MPDDETQAGATESAAGDAANTEGSQAPTQEDITQLKAVVEKERAAAKKATADAKAVRDELAKLQNAGKSDAERLAAERDALAAKVEALAVKARSANGREAVRSAAKAAGAHDQDLIYRLAKSDIEYDDDDEPTNVTELIDTLKRAHPDLFKAKPGKADAGGEAARGKPPKGVTMNDWIRQQAGRV